MYCLVAHTVSRIYALCTGFRVTVDSHLPGMHHVGHACTSCTGLGLCFHAASILSLRTHPPMYVVRLYVEFVVFVFTRMVQAHPGLTMFCRLLICRLMCAVYLRCTPGPATRKSARGRRSVTPSCSAPQLALSTAPCDTLRGGCARKDSPRTSTRLCA